MLKLLEQKELNSVAIIDVETTNLFCVPGCRNPKSRKITQFENNSDSLKVRISEYTGNTMPVCL